MRKRTRRAVLVGGFGADDDAADADVRWRAFGCLLAEVLEALVADEYLVLEAPGGRFVQVAVRTSDLLVETVGNHYLPAGDELQFDDLDELHALGWLPPAYVPAGDECPDQAERTQSPNHWTEFPADEPLEYVAILLVATLRRVHRVGDPESLSYLCFDDSGRRILIPGLRHAEDRTP